VRAIEVVQWKYLTVQAHELEIETSFVVTLILVRLLVFIHTARCVAAVIVVTVIAVMVIVVTAIVVTAIVVIIVMVIVVIVIARVIAATVAILAIPNALSE